MERFFGFDLGDAESAVARLDAESQGMPELLNVGGDRSFVTACATMAGGELYIGEKACCAAGALKRRLRFKSRFLTDRSAAEDVERFGRGVLGMLTDSGQLVRDEDCCFYIGCPAGWNKNERERYRSIFERAGYPPVRIISESRAAMVSACQSRHLQVGYDILSKPVLVVDIGSSTTDFAYVMGGREVEMHTAGEVALGGGLMDELLLAAALEDCTERETVEQVFAESEAWKNYCEFQARRLKEKYFSDEEYWAEEGCRETVLLRFREPVKLRLRMDRETAERLLRGPHPRLDGKSFQKCFTESLHSVREQLPGPMPELLFLTGGVSRLREIRDWCAGAFPEAVVIAGAEPEFSVARGLAWSGRIDHRLRAFRQDIDALLHSDTVEKIVSASIEKLYRSAVDTLVTPILLEVADPIFNRWRDGEIRRLGDVDELLQQEIGAYLRSERARELLSGPIAAWLRPVAEALEEHTMPICVSHHVPYRALSLTTGVSASELDIRLDARAMFAVGELTWLIDSIISILVGLLCGGSGIALISSGPAGFAAGIAGSLLVLVLGKERMEKALLKADLPRPMRRIMPKSAFRSRIDMVSREVRRKYYAGMEKDNGLALGDRLAEDISAQIERCLTRMAEVVEIPLG
ncbi:MAG: Hsp70 family protein [Oscillospiraceae bacterium]|nr:Hsp70 family protein [Oscillospiraceae bacterium]